MCPIPIEKVIKATFLGKGTSTGVPLIGCRCQVCRSDDPRDQRLRSSLLLEVSNKKILIDTGPDFRQQMLKENVNHLDAVLITHEHRDHVGGLDDIRALNFIQKRAIDVYATTRVINDLKQTFAYIFKKTAYSSLPQINLIEISNEDFMIDNLLIRPIEVMHAKLPVLGFRFGNFTYITDANFISQKEKEKIKGTETLVINALRHEKHVSHFTLEESLQLIEELEPKRTYLTHISHQLGLYSEIDKHLPENVFLAYDGLKLTA